MIEPPLKTLKKVKLTGPDESKDLNILISVALEGSYKDNTDALAQYFLLYANSPTGLNLSR
jgi:hypothetical protein